MTIVHRTRTELAGRPVADAVTARGKELSAGDTVGAARRLFLKESVRVVPVLDGTAYAGALDRESIDDSVPDSAPVGPLAAPLLPTALASATTADALAQLDRDGSTRLVVLADDNATFVGIVCLRSDRERLCVDAAFHADPATQPSRGHS